MTQAQLERAVCRATGETRDIVRRLGFQFVNTPKPQPPRHNFPPSRRRRLVAGRS